MNNWITQHIQAIRLVMSRLKNQLTSTLFIAFAIAVSLAIPTILYLVITSLSSLAGNVKSESHITVFLSQQSDATVRDTIHNILASNAHIKSFKFVSKDQALDTLKESSQHQDVLAGLQHNPLPDAFFVEPVALDDATVNSLRNELQTLDGVQDIHTDNAWLKRLSYLLSLGKKAMVVLALLLGFALFAVIGNTIRMQILTQQEEIEVSQLIGATKNFIRRPFLYAGAAYSLLGAFIAMLISTGVIMLFNQSISQLAADYETEFSLQLPNADIWLTAASIAMTIGLASAYLAVSKSLFKSIN